MSDPELLCEVRTEGGVYRDWVGVSISQNILNEKWLRRFSLRCAEPSEKVLRLPEAVA